MIQTGLVSVTFRQLSPQEVVELAAQAGLAGIEWGGDIHVPHGELQTAKQVLALTRHAGLQVAAYGSYYRVGVSPAQGLLFERVLETALALQAPTIRVWAGQLGSAQADETYRRQVVEDARRIARLAHEAGASISFEFHGGTLTDTAESTLQLHQQIGRDDVYLYWQPLSHLRPDARPQGLQRLLPHLSNVHVFHWTASGPDLQRHPLASGDEPWREYLRLLKGSESNHFALLEFVAGDSPEQFLADAQTLRQWLKS